VLQGAKIFYKNHERDISAAGMSIWEPVVAVAVALCSGSNKADTLYRFIACGRILLEKPSRFCRKVPGRKP